MNESVSSRRIVRFGVYELDLDSEELRKSGLKIKLSGQPSQVLVMLLERPGDVVSREELQKKLWPDGTFVDFDHSLNTAINKIREALGDSAENPRFVETLARRGYRFIASVATETGGLSVIAEQPESLPVDHVKPNLGSLFRRRSRRVMVVSLLLVATSCFVWWIISKRSLPGIPLRLTRLTSDPGLTFQPALSPDGTYVAYASDRSGEGNLDIWIQPVASGEPRRLTQHQEDDYEPAFSPDGARIAFRSDRDKGGIYVVSSLGGEARLIVREGRNPRFSPDGKWISYRRFIEPLTDLLGTQPGRAFVVDAASGSVRSILPEFVVSEPIWSSDGKYLLFYGSPPGTWFYGGEADWWVAPIDGGQPIETGALKLLSGMGISISYPSPVPCPAVWQGERVLFSASLGDSTNLWQLSLSPSFRVHDPVVRLTSGIGLEVYPSLARGGNLIVAGMTQSINIWSLTFDSLKRTWGDKPSPVTESTAFDYSPSVSADGRKLAFISNRSGNDEVWFKDLMDGKERKLTDSLQTKQHGVISRDGSRIAYLAILSRSTANKPVSAMINVVSTFGGFPEEVWPNNNAYVWDWSDDGELLVFKKGLESRPLHLLDLTRRKEALLLSHRDYSLFQGRFSPDGRWIAFVALGADGCHLFLAPFNRSREITESEWIPVTHDKERWADKPRWGPDGSSIYFVSDRDGYFCIWRQSLNPQSKRPVGPPLEVAHFHSARRSMFNAGIFRADIDVAADKIVFTLGEYKGNLWMTKPDWN
jgi:Tol biopolymer transport system component/DNA-binding winged helix-turn-helix (wHTH) protein